MKAKYGFGTILENGYASDNNPLKYGRFIRIVVRTGRVNPGRFVQAISGDHIWETPENSDRLVKIGDLTDTLEGAIERRKKALNHDVSSKIRGR